MEGRVRNRKTCILFCIAVAAIMASLGGCGGDDNPPPPVTYSISGTVSGAVASGVTVNLTGTSTETTTTDGSGNYSFTGLANGTYALITPSKSGYMFIPVSIELTVNGANVTGVNFTAARNNASLNGDYLFIGLGAYSAPLTYCDLTGIMSFDGAGSVDESHTVRCSDGTTATTSTENGTAVYSVNADGSFTLTDPVTPSDHALHGQMVLDGSSLLLDLAMLDETLLPPAGTVLEHHVAMKRVTAGTPPTYDNASLNGDYLFIVTEVHDPGTMTYCEQSGTVSFDGAGSVTVNGTSRCSDGTTVTTSAKTETINYSVSADGSFTINADGPKPLHGQIALDGTSLLLDGTMQGTSANDYLNHGIAMKRVTAGTPPAYDNASLNGDYLFIVTEVHDPGTTTYCEQAGTVSFDGAGSVTVNGTSRCSDGTTATISPLSGTLDYSVNADGSFAIHDPADPPEEAFHGQIALDGRSLLLDASMRPSAGTLLDHGVAMKR